jgi:hypothetical protein
LKGNFDWMKILLNFVVERKILVGEKNFAGEENM